MATMIELRILSHQALKSILMVIEAGFMCHSLYALGGPEYINPMLV